MAYSVNLPAAARRHLDAAEQLASGRRIDVAGYLFGIAAECAVKEMARELPDGRTDAIFYGHFPELRTLLLDALQGRKAQPLRRLLEHGSFMNQWDIRMRYASGDEVKGMPIAEWAEQARRAVSMMGS